MANVMKRTVILFILPLVISLPDEKMIMTNCRQKCNSSTYEECNEGCSLSLRFYVKMMEEEITPLPEPVLIRASKNASSVTLLWKERLTKVKLYVHKLLPEMHRDWQIHEYFLYDADIGTIHIYDLHPYVTYNFKVIVALTSSPRYVFVSPVTFPITTLPLGVPASSPKITRLYALSPTMISLSWQRPLFSNGPLLSYRIDKEPVGNDHLKTTTLEVSANVTSWNIRSCQSSQLYRFSVSAWNAAGEGPADVRQVTTPNPGNLTAHETPYLLMGEANKIITLNTLDIVKMQSTIHTIPPGTSITDMYLWYEHIAIVNVEYKENIIHTCNLKGVSHLDMLLGLSYHIRHQLIFASSSDGHITSISIKKRTFNNHTFKSILQPGALAVDWLSDRLFIASETRVYSCPLDNDRCFIVLDNLMSTPTDIKVDPINGYIFYCQRGTGKGLYRLNLPLVDKPLIQSISHQLVEMDDLVTFVVDFEELLIYFPNNTQNTIMATSLDGSNCNQYRAKVFRRAYRGATSLAYCNRLFFWTDGTTPWMEEYEPQFSQYRHNHLLLFDPPFSAFQCFHPVAQPVPVPVAPPSEVHGLFTKTAIIVRWSPPLKLQYQGHGAWSRWAYSVEMKHLIGVSCTQPIVAIHETRNVTHTFTSLMHSTSYCVRVRAYSESGFGPWSEYFVGATLREGREPLMVLFGVPGKIMETNFNNFSEVDVIHFLNEAVDIAWTKCTVLWTTTSGDLYIYNRRDSSMHLIPMANGAYSVAYDWLGEKVYWSEPKLNLIRRCDYRGILSETVFHTEASDLAIDSLSGRLYWTTTNTVERVYLNGEHHMKMFSAPEFSGRLLVGLTLNFDIGKIMWIEKNYSSQSLWMADLGQEIVSAQTVCSYSVPFSGFSYGISRIPRLQYYSQHLFWIDAANHLMMGDMTCNHSSTVLPGYNNITAFTLIHDSLQKTPVVESGNVVVIPQAIDRSSLHMRGTWSNFNITWLGDTVVNYGQIFYNLFLDAGHDKFHEVTSHPWYSVHGLSPYTQLIISLQPYTYWAYSETTTASMRSPMSSPGAPTTPRLYIMPHKSTASAALQTMAVDLRWSAPEATNGVLVRHVITHWINHERRQVIEVAGTAHRYVLAPLEIETTYHFQIAACTEIGCGPKSVTVSATTDAISPVPILLIATADGILLSEFDRQLESSTFLPHIKASAFVCLAKDNETFMIESQSRVLLRYHNFDKGEEYAEVKGGRKISFDWISRTLYVVTDDDNHTNNIVAFNVEARSLSVIVSCHNVNIGMVAMDPYKSVLLWTEVDNTGNGMLMSMHLWSPQDLPVVGSTHLESGLTNRRNPAKPLSCTCPRNVNIWPIFAMDHTGKDNKRVVFFDTITSTFFASDVDGCHYTSIFRPSGSESVDYSPNLLAVDHLRVYWYSSIHQMVYSINKKSGGDLTMQYMPGISDIVAYGTHLQPFPESECLDPGAYQGNVVCALSSNTSLSLTLDVIHWPATCEYISSPVQKYTVHYKMVDNIHSLVTSSCVDSPDSCQKLHFYSRRVHLNGLQPFTQYLIQVAVSNYYTEYLSKELSPPVRFTTSPGVPDKATSVILEPMTPEEMMVTWRLPRKLNGPRVNFSHVVSFATTSAHGHFTRRVEELSFSECSDDICNVSLRNMLPNHAYDVQIITCMMGRSLCNVSDTVHNRTFNNPDNFTVVQATHNSLALTWTLPEHGSVRHHYCECAMAGKPTLTWKRSLSSPILAESYTAYVENFTDLGPYTLYAFRLKLTYSSLCAYVWPKDHTRFVFRTSAWTPGRPLPPVVRPLPHEEACEVMWSEPVNNGMIVTNYSLMLCDAVNNRCQEACYGAERQCLLGKQLLVSGVDYVFRLAAHNAMGWSPFSDASAAFQSPLDRSRSVMEKDSASDKFTTAVVICFAIGIVICIAMAIYWHEEVANLPHVSRDQFALTHFLGKGAFGEVYEGVARDLRPDMPGLVLCAVKTLKKSSTGMEKDDFLKEAIVMRNFQHKHILGLLGVCLDSDPHFILMQLMLGGDLLSFLRSSRPTTVFRSGLSLSDLMTVCLHVVNGCRYLEDMHFVHRDLAARNCLVTSRDVSNMIVKIGDFGLTRDIYKNDYYRKEGRGLLPVRWMSPESLLDGVFTTQSDIWAFGVLVWEVMTLGQQPYPARTNIDVLHYVRGGGMLDRPATCPDNMFNLMLRCWKFSPQDRPSFSSLLCELESYHEKSVDQMAVVKDICHRTIGINGDGGMVTAAGKMVPSSLGKGSEKPTSNRPAMTDSLNSSVGFNQLSLSKSSPPPYSHTAAPDDCDAMGYLKPGAAHGGPQYLRLLNEAPELDLPSCHPRNQHNRRNGPRESILQVSGLIPVNANAAAVEDGLVYKHDVTDQSWPHSPSPGPETVSKASTMVNYRTDLRHKMKIDQQMRTAESDSLCCTDVVKGEATVPVFINNSPVSPTHSNLSHQVSTHDSTCNCGQHSSFLSTGFPEKCYPPCFVSLNDGGFNDSSVNARFPQLGAQLHLPMDGNSPAQSSHCDDDAEADAAQCAAAGSDDRDADRSCGSVLRMPKCAIASRFRSAHKPALCTQSRQQSFLSSDVRHCGPMMSPEDTSHARYVVSSCRHGATRTTLV